MPFGRGDLGRVHRARVPDVRARERAARREQRLAEHGVGAHELRRRTPRPVGSSCERRVGEPADQRRDARLLRLGQPDPEVEAERLGDLVAEVRADALAGDAADDLADEPAVRRRVVAVLRCRVPSAEPAARGRRPPDPTTAPARASSSPSTHASPAWCDKQIRRPGCRSLPPAANSGQYVATGASTSSAPSCASLLAHIAVAPLVVENTSASVSSSHGRPVVGDRRRRPRGRRPFRRGRYAGTPRRPRALAKFSVERVAYAFEPAGRGPVALRHGAGSTKRRPGRPRPVHWRHLRSSSS